VPIFSSFSSTPARALGTTSASKPGKPFNINVSDIGISRSFNNGAASVSFEHKGVRANFFTVTSFPENIQATGASSPIIVEGLSSDTNYTFTVTATNSIGTSKVSDTSASVTATTVPQAPTLSSASSNGNRTSVVSTFSSGASGGKAVSTFTTKRTGASQNGASSPITLSGLSAGTTYGITVTATNENGESLPSNSIDATTFNATGGDITEVGGFIIHRFTGNSTFSPNQSKSVEYLVVAGGGSGGGPNTNFGGQGGGGGAGGVLSGSTTISTSQSITVGNGGAYHPTNGQNSSIGSIVVSTGGGHGGRGDNVYGPGSGGSGGGRARGTSGGGGTGIAGQGFAGGSNANLSWGHGAGGGAGGVGANGGGDLSSAVGGASITSSITGSSVEYARGGNGGSRDGGGTTHLGVNTGAGGGGGASGRSGVVVIRYSNV
jgi:hypothetical protein